MTNTSKIGVEGGFFFPQVNLRIDFCQVSDYENNTTFWTLTTKIFRITFSSQIQ